MRDDFSQTTKDLLANRVGWKCSNPNCRKATRGAGMEKNGYYKYRSRIPYYSGI